MSSFFSFKSDSSFPQDVNSTANFPGLSARAAPFQKHAKSYNREFGKILSEGPYNKETKPDGVILLGVSENKLMGSELETQVSTVFQETVPHHIAHYTAPHGLPELRTTLSHFLSEKFLNWKSEQTPECPINPDHVVVSTGCVASLTLFSRLLFEPNDSVLIPAPYYPAFDHDFFSYGSVHVVEVHGETADDSTQNDCVTPTDEDSALKSWFESTKKSFGLITRGSLEASYNRSVSLGHQPRAFLYTNPSNPTGQFLKEIEIIEILKFCSEKNLHLIADEVYALNRYGETSRSPYTSILNYLAPFLYPEDSLENKNFLKYKLNFSLPPIHFLWSISKDFSLSGFRLGVTYSPPLHLYRNDLINYRPALDSLIYSLIPANDAFMVSNLTQYFLHKLLNNKNLINDYLTNVKLKLNKNLSIILKKIHKFLSLNNKFSYNLYDVILPAQGGLFVMVNLSSWLSLFPSYIQKISLKNSEENNSNGSSKKFSYSDSISNEENFFQFLIFNGILLTPSESCNKDAGVEKYLGHFRCCYAYVTPETLEVAMDRLTAALTKIQEGTQ